MGHFVETNGIKLHYHDYPGGDREPLLLMHGLTANAHSFSGLINAGLAENRRVLLVDLRGRGLSDKPEYGYTMPDHAADIIGMLDALGINRVVLGGHSFGGLLTLYTAANFPERVKKLVVIDAAAEVARIEIVELIKPSLQRLGQRVPSADDYVERIKAAPYFHDGFWDEHLEAFYRADVTLNEDGTVSAHAGASQMTQAIDGVLAEDWHAHFAKIDQPALLIQAPEGFGPPGTPSVVSTEGAQETVNLLKNCQHVQVEGNHITMMFGKHAPNMVKTITTFIDE